jgi:ComF family protein
LRTSILGLWQGTLDLVLPPSCLDCAAPVPRDALLCVECDAKWVWLAAELCTRCQSALPAPGGSRCPQCAVARGPLDACVAAFAYRDAVETWTRRFKYPRHGLRGFEAGPRALMCRAAREAARLAPGLPPDRVVPVPQHASRLRARGFNPAAVLARAVAREMGVPCDPVAVIRTRATPSQTGLDRNQRRRNVRDAFGVQGRVADRRIWLVDDVTTTGATLGEVARALKRAGARSVVGICAARRL